MPALSNDDIINGIKNNEDHVIEYLYKNAYQQVLNLIVNNNGTSEDAKDVFQEALLVIHRKIADSGLTLTCSFSTYLYSISRYLWFNELRKKKSVQLKAIEDIESFTIEKTPDDLLEKKKLKIYFQHFMELSKDCKRILHMYFNNYPVERITQILGFSNKHHTINRKYRCQQYLIKRIHNNPEFTQLKDEI